MPLDADEERLLEDNPLLRVAVFGLQTQDFLKTDLGQYLVSCATHDMNNAVNKLKKVAPWRTRKIQELQNQIKVSENFMSWINDAIQQGTQAQNQLEDQ